MAPITAGLALTFYYELIIGHSLHYKRLFCSDEGVIKSCDTKRSWVVSVLVKLGQILKAAFHTRIDRDDSRSRLQILPLSKIKEVCIYSTLVFGNSLKMCTMVNTCSWSSRFNVALLRIRKRQTVGDKAGETIATFIGRPQSNKQFIAKLRLQFIYWGCRSIPTGKWIHSRQLNTSLLRSFLKIAYNGKETIKKSCAFFEIIVALPQGCTICFRLLLSATTVARVISRK